MDDVRQGEYPHLDAYRDLKPRIDAAIKKVEFLLGYQRTYFSVKDTLCSVLRRLNNEGYFARIINPSAEAIAERERALPYKETIERLIDDIDAYETENKKLLSAIVSNGIIHSRELVTLYPYLSLLAEDNSSHDRIPAELISFFYEGTREKCELFSEEEYAIFLYLLIKIKEKGRYYFAYPQLADELYAIATERRIMPYNSRTEFLLAAGDYYVSACQRRRAMECYGSAASASEEKGDLESAAYALQRYYRLNNSLPEKMRAKADADEIKRRFKGYADIVYQGMRSPSLKVDPSEFTDEFAEHFQDVMWKVEVEIDRVGELHTPLQRWSLMERYFAEKGVTWRSPVANNPGVMFD